MEISTIDVEYFLTEFKFKLDFWGLIYRSDRDKNKITLLELDFDIQKVRRVLENLETKDYVEGPTEDTLYRISPMWIFGKEIKGREVYIKISMGNENDKVLCISFHFAEFILIFPFK